MIQDTPLVSICCIAYNQENYIRETLDGFLMQKTTFSFEIIVHDDASNDKTPNIIKEYADKYPDKFVILLQNENQWSKGGGSIFTRFVFPRAKGKYFALCEGDDYWTDPLKLQKQVDFLDANPKYSLVWSDVDRLYQSSGIMIKNALKDIPIKNTLDDFLIKGWFTATCTWVFKSEVMLEENKYPFRNSYSVGDLRILLMSLDHGEVTQFPQDKSTAVYRVLDKSASHFRSFKDIFRYQKGVLQIQLDFASYYNAPLYVKVRILYRFIRKIIRRVLNEILCRAKINS